MSETELGVSIYLLSSRMGKLLLVPTINAPAKELLRVFEILIELEEIRKKLGFPSIVAVMDQALYAKAVEIAWKEAQFVKKN